MTTGVSPTDRIRAKSDALFARDRDLGEVVEEVPCLGARLILQIALEAEVTEFLPQERYERGDRARAGSRNGHSDVTVKTTAGPVTLERPKMRVTDEAFASRLLGKHVTRTSALESLTSADYVRGLFIRDVEAALSKSTVSRVCEAIRTEFDSWRARRLADVDLEYLYLDASHFRFHHGARAEPIMVAYRITSDGTPRLLAVEAVSAESHDAVVAFLRDMVARGLRAPPLTITDGAPGLIGAVEQVFPDSLRQRCVIHRCRNLLAKVSTPDQAEIKGDYWAIFDDTTAEPGDPAVAEARRRAAAFDDKWRQRYPSAVACVTGDLDTLTVHLRFPRGYHKRIRHTNLIERTFAETRRRAKVIGRLPGERSCLSLVWAVLDRASRRWRGVDMDPRERPTAPTDPLRPARTPTRRRPPTRTRRARRARRRHTRRGRCTIRNPRSPLFHQSWDATPGRCCEVGQARQNRPQTVGRKHRFQFAGQLLAAAGEPVEFPGGVGDYTTVTI